MIARHNCRSPIGTIARKRNYLPLGKKRFPKKSAP